MRLARLFAAVLLTCPVNGLGAPRTVSDTATDLKDCALKLKDVYTVRRTVVWPSNRIGGSVESGGPSGINYTVSWNFPKARIVAEAGLGDPNWQTIESVKTVDLDVSGDASVAATVSSDVITFTWHVHKEWFGGGATAKARLEIVFRESDSDATITSIGRICAAKILGQART